MVVCDGTAVLLEIVTYNPLRRIGFIRSVDLGSPGRVYFTLSMLPEEFKRPRIVRSRPLNDRSLPPEEWKRLTHELRKDLIGRRFEAKVRRLADGRLNVVRRSVKASDRVAL